MTDQSLAIHRPTVELMAVGSQEEIQRMAGKLVKFSPGGSNLSMDQATSLAIYAWMTDLNPYNNECYWMDKVGPTAGIAGYRRKAKEYNRRMGGDEGWDYKVTYRLAEAHEADFDSAAGDVAWVCELTDTKAEKEWQDVYMKFYKMYTDNDAPYKEADAMASRFAGERPSWSAVGVVKVSEKFSGVDWEDWKAKKPKKDANGETVYKAEMWDRNERAKKRAEKGALRKRYPDLLIPDFGEVYDDNVAVTIKEVSEVIDAEVVQSRATFEAMAPEEHTEAADDIVGELGFEGDKPEEVQDPLWTEPDPNEIYWDVADSKGTPYREKKVTELSFSLNALNKKVKAFKEPTNDDELTTQNDMLLKRDAVLYWMNLKKDQENG